MTKPIERRLAALERGRLALPGRFIHELTDSELWRIVAPALPAGVSPETATDEDLRKVADSRQPCG